MLLIDFLFIPVAFIKYCIKYLARFILKDEFVKENELLNKSFDRNKELNDLKNKYENENKLLNSRLKRLKEIIENNKDKKCEFSLTKSGEIICFAYNGNKFFDSIYVFGENGKDTNKDCFMNFSNCGEVLKIEDFMSKNQNHGYGRALMSFVIQKAYDENKKYIKGGLSSVDSQNFKWLIPFYESFGFECKFLADQTRSIVGSVNLDLEKRQKSLNYN